MNSYLASPLHLVASILNLPLFHKEIHSFPENLTYQGVQLIAVLSKDGTFAYQTNMEAVQFLSISTSSLSDIQYTQATQYFVRLLASILGKQDPVWGAISYILVSVAHDFEDKKEHECWRKLCGFFFYVFTEEGIAKIDQGDIPTVRPQAQDDRPSLEQYAMPQPNKTVLPSILTTPTELAQKASQLLNNHSSPSSPLHNASSSSPSSSPKQTETRRGIQIKNRY
jgi:hypothetical protein